MLTSSGANRVDPQCILKKEKRKRSKKHTIGRDGVPVVSVPWRGRSGGENQ